MASDSNATAYVTAEELFGRKGVSIDLHGQRRESEKDLAESADRRELDKTCLFAVICRLQRWGSIAGCMGV